MKKGEKTDMGSEEQGSPTWDEITSLDVSFAARLWKFSGSVAFGLIM